MISISTIDRAGQGEVVVVASDGQPARLTAQMIRSIQCVTEVQVIHKGRERFRGSPTELAAWSYDVPGLAGEHPIERSIRLLTSNLRGPG
ncbi:MAG: hypothetical protein ACI8TP_001856 [Acidimicrobiales bacterium]|jgi:hypothetical protein